jgi:phenylacetyl-CoA:acceptor oxidoreductase
VPLKTAAGDFSLDPARHPDRDTIWDAVCRAASAELTDGAQVHGLDWWKEHGLATRPFPRSDWYLYPTMVERGLRFELPYQERLARVGVELGRRLHENGMDWWDQQLHEYQALPACKDFSQPWSEAVRGSGAAPEDYPLWLLTARSMQYAWGGNVGLQMIHEVADNVAGHRGVIINAGRRAHSASKTATRSRSRRRSAPSPAVPCCARACDRTRCWRSASSAIGSRRWPRTSACPA